MILLVTALFLCSVPVLQVLSAPVNEPDPQNGTCLYDGLTMADPADSRAYFVCCAHYWLIKYCQQDEYFDKYNLTCLPQPSITLPTAPHLLSDTPPTDINIPTDDNSTTFTEAPETTTLFCVPDDRKANPIDPATFDVCINGTHYVTRRCSDGYVFNARTKRCQMLPRSTTMPPRPLQCINGQTRPDHPSVTYLECISNRWVEFRCPQGQMHYPGRRGCQYPPRTTTWKPPTRRPTKTTRRSTTRRPFVDGPCQESAGQDGFRPNPFDCQTYFQCVHSEWMLRDCGPGTQWEQAILGCDYYNGVCTQ